MKILIPSMQETLLYAAEELKKYVVTMSRGAINPDIDILKTPKAADRGEIILGTFPELSIAADDYTDPKIEDVIEIDIKEMSGYIAGSNERSVLMGVYRLCASAGCRYLRPGADGDYVPYVPNLATHSFKYRKKADKNFRGECTEGAVSYEHIRDTVYFLPKIGMNMYMIEGLVPYNYMHMWYGHVHNDNLRTRPSGQVTDYDMLYNYVKLLERDIKKTGIQLHTLGHAWMFEGLGISLRDLNSQKEAVARLSDEERSLFALVNGKRDIFADSTFYTHLCYSNPKARRLLVDYMVKYAKENPHVDFIHFWLADGVNNSCECEECSKRTASDWYVMMLNELDQRLTEEGLDTRVALIAYVDTLRPPKELRLNNANRFILISAIGSYYEKGYGELHFEGEEPPYEKNKYVAVSNALRLKWAQDWKRLNNNIPTVVFEYRFYKDMYCDLSYMRISRETYRDMKALDSIKFDGCMSDQTHRMYIPTSLPLIMMGETQFDTSIDFDKTADCYFLGAFGEDGPLVREYLEKMSPLMSPSNFRVGGKFGIEEEGIATSNDDEKPWNNNPAVAKRAEQIPALIEGFLPVIKRNLFSATDAARLKSWHYLEYHADICLLHAKILAAGGSGDVEAVKEIYKEIRKYHADHELEFHDGFDSFLYVWMMIGKTGLSSYYWGYFY